MAYEVFWISGSPYAWRVMLALAVKGVAYDSRLINASERQQKSPEYLKMNPRGKVPVLKDGETIIAESLAILTYLEEKHPTPPLFGETPADKARIWQAVCEAENYFMASAGTVFRTIFFGDPKEKADEIKEAALATHEELKGYEKILSRSHFLAGENISAVDLVVYPGVMVLLRAMEKDEAVLLNLGFLPFDDHYPNIAAWMARIEALPGYNETYPPHWRS